MRKNRRSSLLLFENRMDFNKKILCYIDKNEKHARGKIVEKHYET